MAYRDYEKKTFDAWDIDDDNQDKVNVDCSEKYASGHLPISVADSDAVAQQIIKSHQEKLKSSSSVDSSPISHNSIKSKGPGPGKAQRQSILTNIQSSSSQLQSLNKAAKTLLPISNSSEQVMPWSRKSSEDKNCEASYAGATLSSIVKVDLEAKNNTVVTTTAASSNGARFGLSPLLGSSREEDETIRLEKFKRLLSANPIDLNELQKACWKGIPKIYRHICWKLLSDYLPLNLELQEKSIEQKRQAYWEAVAIHYGDTFIDSHHDMLRQILNDIPRMNPLLPIFQNKIIQDIFQRVLYVWAVRHPGTGYVQGINDLLTPFFVVFLTEYTDTEIQNLNIESMIEAQRRNLEADCYWCMNKLLERIQENYVCSQPGIQKNIRRLEYLIKRIDGNLYNHLKKNNIEFIQFAFRWMNNLLMREIPLTCTIRLWDTYHAEPFGFSDFHLYVCAAFLMRFSRNLCEEKDFQGLMMTLQNLPTKNLKASDIELLTAEAYQLQVMFANSPNHTSI